MTPILTTVMAGAKSEPYQTKPGLGSNTSFFGTYKLGASLIHFSQNVMLPSMVGIGKYQELIRSQPRAL